MDADRCRAARVAARAAGLCAKCLKRPSGGAGYLCCDTCRWAANERHRQRARRALKEGVCTVCTKGQPKPGRLTCVDCLSKRRSPYVAGTEPMRRRR